MEPSLVIFWQWRRQQSRLSDVYCVFHRFDIYSFLLIFFAASTANCYRFLGEEICAEAHKLCLHTIVLHFLFGTAAFESWETSLNLKCELGNLKWYLRKEIARPQAEHIVHEQIVRGHAECESVKAENTALKATQEPLFELQAPKKKKKKSACKHVNAGSILAQQKR